MMDHKELAAALDYDPQTGRLFWKCRANDPAFNTRFGGKEAFLVDHDGYRRGKFMGKHLFAHHAAWAIFYGAFPDGQIDHVNQVRSDNRIENLRVVTPSENQRNKRLHRNNTSGHIGVYWADRQKRWKAGINHNGHVHLGYFRSLEEAIAARMSAQVQFGYSDRHGAAS